jgi:hypothetical protein
MSDIKSYFAKNQATAHENFLHANGGAAAGAAKGAGSAAKGAASADLIGQAVKLAADITVGVYSSKQQVKLQKDLAKLSGEQQQRLAEELGKANTQAEKLRILQNAQNQAKNREITLIVVGSLVGIAGIVLTVVLLRKRK